MMLLLSPLTWLLLAGALLLPSFRLCARWLGAACLAIAAVAFLAMTPLLANVLVARLEQPGPVDSDCTLRPPTTIVVLAAGLAGEPLDAHDISAINLAGRRRLDRAVQYWRNGDGRTLVMTGTSSDGASPSDATLMTAYVAALGVPGSVVRTESRALDTWGNASHVAAMTPRVARRITLVTSAIHMIRATMAFKASGFQVCPLPADSRLSETSFPGLLLPRSTSLTKTEDGLHELVGMAYYRWRRTNGSGRPLGRLAE